MDLAQLSASGSATNITDMGEAFRLYFSEQFKKECITWFSNYYSFNDSPVRLVLYDNVKCFDL